MDKSSDMAQALILFAHGARDPRWAEPLARIQELVASRVDSSVQVAQAFLELMSPTLPELVREMEARGVRRILIVPIFLGQGGHVRNDLPKLIQELQTSYPSTQFLLAPAIGEDPQVLEAIAAACVTRLA